jgi:hypothetical protein
MGVTPKMTIRWHSMPRLPGTGTSRPASSAGFWGVFPDVPILGFIWDSGDFKGDKTGLFGAVWIEDREVGWGILWVGGF